MLSDILSDIHTVMTALLLDCKSTLIDDCLINEHMVTLLLLKSYVYYEMVTNVHLDPNSSSVCERAGDHAPATGGTAHDHAQRLR